MNREYHRDVLIIGGGPAGLTAGYELAKAGRSVAVFEKDHVVGGIARTVSHNGYHFDIGGHRFFTKVARINALWQEMLEPGQWVHCTRLSRIFYNQHFYYYPLRMGNVLKNLGAWNSFCILLSYLQAQVFPREREESFEDWVINRFGERLYRTFFKSYTEKVWGIPGREIQADWAAQRIQGLSLASAVRNALLGPAGAGRGRHIKTLTSAFQYPRRGPGMLWQRVTEKIRALGGEVHVDSRVERIRRDGNRVTGLVVNTGGRREEWTANHVISSMPLSEWVRALAPAPPGDVAAAADALKYRDFLTVALIIDRPDLFPDHWIYIHDPSVKVGRIQNFKNWSPDMVPDPAKTCLGLEYFCFENDDLWSMRDSDLIDLAARELEAIGLARRSQIEGGAVVRMPKAYPVYDNRYASALETLRAFLGTFENAQTAGRNGMHRYNNQDHSMLTALLAAQNIMGANHDLWAVNLEKEYHEE